MSYHDGAIKLREDAISDPEGAEKYKYIELSHPIHDDEHGYPYVEVGMSTIWIGVDVMRWM